MTSKIHNIAMFVIAAFAIGGLTVSSAYAYSITSDAEDDWTIPSGSDFTVVDDGGECNNDVTVITNTAANTIQVIWDGNDSCNQSIGHSGSPAHDWNKVRADIYIDGTHYNIDITTAYAYNGNITYNQSISGGESFDIDFRWYYSNTS